MTKPVTPQDMFDLWQKMVNPGAYPLQSLMFPMPDSKEIEKKIGELEVVEHWLKANVTMVQLTVKSLQYQLAMLKGGEKAQEVFAAGREKDAKDATDAKDTDEAAQPPNPAMWAWNMMAEATKPSPKPSAPKKAKKR